MFDQQPIDAVSEWFDIRLNTHTHIFRFAYFKIKRLIFTLYTTKIRA